MSINLLFQPNNDYHLYCDQMTCNSVIGSNTIYTASSSLTGDRTVDLAGHFLKLGNNNIEITDTGNIISQNITANANVTLNGPLFDHNSSAGLANQVLSTNGANVTWINLPADTVSSVFGRVGAVAAQSNDYNINQLAGVSISNPLNNQILAYNGTDFINTNLPATPATIYNSDGIISDATRTIDGNGADLNFNNISILTNNVGRNITNASSRVEINTPTLILNQLTNGLLQVDNSGNVTTVANSNLGFVIHTTPGSYNITVPANATLAKLTGVGGGGGSCLHIGFASPGGGAAGSVFDYPVSVLAGQTIAITVGAGGAVNTDGTDTVFNIGTQTITCGKGLTSTDQLHGGNGGSVNLGFTTISGGAGGAFQVQGSNGNSSYFVCSGAGGGGTRANGGNALLFTGGAADANYGGGGASAFANGANNHANGSKGSGGGADSGTGGDGFATIIFYS